MLFEFESAPHTKFKHTYLAFTKTTPLSYHKGIMNIIYSPDQKYFTLPVLLIVEHYKNIGEPVVVVCSKLAEAMFRLYGFYNTDASDSKYLTEDVNCVFFQHNTLGAINFFKNKIGTINERLDNFYISLMPDGLGNAMYGERFSEVAEAITNRDSILRDVFSFGFAHNTTARLYDSRYIKVLSYEGMDRYLESALAIEGNRYILDVLSSYKNIILIAYRPWGTKNFHGGIYDFGSNQELAEIYNEIIAHCAKSFSIPLEDSLLAYRGDSRFLREASEVYEAISFHDKFLIDNWLDDRYTLELIIYYLINKTSSNIFIITLDSTTFQCVPFMRREKNGHIVGAVGCFEPLINSFSEGNNTFVKKITGKVNDFRNRYRLIEEAENYANLKVEPIDKSFFYVDIR